MKTRKMDQLPKCDFCKKTDTVIFDSPTIYGHWGYMCQKCFNTLSSNYGRELGTKLVLREESARPLPAKGILIGLEAPIKDMLSANERVIECPNCHELRTMEIDAECVITCEGCDSQIQIKALV